MSGANELHHRLQNAVNKMMEELDETKIRPMQKNTYLGMASCFDVRGTSQQQVQQCLDQQGQLLQATQNLIQNEMNSFQDRLQRCSKACQDETQDKFDLSSAGQEDTALMAKAESYMTKCAGTCVDKHISLLGPLKSKITSEIDRYANAR
jgi:hypothetical protein